MEQNSSEYILVNMNESFAEVGIYTAQNQYFSRFFLPRLSLAKGIKQIILENEINPPKKLFLTTKIAKTILNKRLGSPPALLVTNGFENWLDMTIPAVESFFTVEVSKPKSPINKDLVFGINERISENGKVLKKIDLSDLEFLAAKLKLNNINHIALCYLHSCQNSVNEKETEDFFLAQGFTVFPSHRYNQDNPLVGDDKTERQRWWFALLNAYIFPSLLEIYLDIESELKEVIGQDLSINIGTSTGDFKSIEETKPLNTLFAKEYFLKNSLTGMLKSESGLNRQGVGCYFGLEEFQLYHLEQKNVQLWSSEFGPVAINKPQFDELYLQPTARIEKGYWSCPTFSDKSYGWEPGPMCLGRSQSPFLIDLLFIDQDLSKIDGLSDYLNKKAASRISETLYAYAKNEHSRSSLSSPEIIEGLNSLFISSTAAQLNAMSYNYVVCCGPLASVIHPLLKTLLKGKQVKLIKEKFVEVKALIPGGKL